MTLKGYEIPQNRASANLRSQQLRSSKRKGVTYQSLATGASLVCGQSVDIVEVHNKRQLRNICSWLEYI